MSLLVLRYGRAHNGRDGNSPAILDAHLRHIAALCPNGSALPGEPLTPRAMNVCLTFDHGYFDFYVHVFPLLKKYGLRAVVTLSPHFIRDSTERSFASRLAVETSDVFADPVKGGLCTWAELQELEQSGRVQIAAYGLTHRRLDDKRSEFRPEIDEPQRILTARLQHPVRSFAVPHGRCSLKALRHARDRYNHVFVSGALFNRGWRRSVVYRLDADGTSDVAALFSPQRLRAYRARSWLYRLRRL